MVLMNTNKPTSSAKVLSLKSTRELSPKIIESSPSGCFLLDSSSNTETKSNKSFVSRYLFRGISWCTQRSVQFGLHWCTLHNKDLRLLFNITQYCYDFIILPRREFGRCTEKWSPSGRKSCLNYVPVGERTWIHC